MHARDTMARMTSRFSAKSGLLGAAAAVTITLASPAIAQADPVDDLLAKVPAGQISCSQAQSQWTNQDDYNSKKAQALAVATFHPRGAEIRDAIARMDEAIARCNLAGTAGNNSGNPAQAPRPQQPAPQPAPAPAPAPAPGKQAPANSNVIPILVSPGMPTVYVPVANVVTFELPDLAAMVQEQFGQLSSR